MEKMDMMPAHKWEPNEKGRNKGDSGSTGKTIKASRMARIRWSYRPSYYHRLPRGTKSNVHAQHNTREGSPTSLVQRDLQSGTIGSGV